MKMPQRPRNEALPEISMQKIHSGWLSLSRWGPRKGTEGLILPSLAGMPAMSGWSYSKPRQTPWPHVSSTVDPVCNRTGDIMACLVGGNLFGPAFMPTAWMALYDPGQGQRFNFQPSAARSLCERGFTVAAVGFCIRTRVRPIRAGTGPGAFQAWTMPGPCQNAFLLTSPSNGNGDQLPRHPASKTINLRNACARLYQSTLGRAWSIRALTGA